MEIDSIDQIVQLTLDGVQDWSVFGDVYAKFSGDLVLFNKATRAKSEWNFFERASRGLILHRKSGEIVARPFDKFFHWGEDGRSTSAEITLVTEKFDGSLGILYRDDGYRVATKGSFYGEHAIWATQFLQEHYRLVGLPDEYTLLFEIIFPDNRLVVNYGSREDLILLAIRNRFSGDYLPFQEVQRVAAHYGFSLPRVGNFHSVSEILADLSRFDLSVEGWVAEFSDGNRFKFKSKRYLELHNRIFMIHFSDILTAIENHTLEDTLQVMPERSLGKIRQWIAEIQAQTASIQQRVERAYKGAPKNNFSDYQEWVANQPPDLALYLLARWEGQDISRAIYAHAFQDRAEEAFFRPSADLLRRIYAVVLEEGTSSGELVRTGRIKRL
jgi:T4 RnlA family RNA ligase